MARVLVLGYGNPLRSDDGLGWQVAVQLFRTNTAPEVEVLPCHQLTPELAGPVSRADTVLFLDISREGSPGEIDCREIRFQGGSVSFTHDLTPAALLDLSSELYGSSPRGFLLSVCGECFNPGDSLSAAVTARLPELKTRIRTLIAESLEASAIAH